MDILVSEDELKVITEGTGPHWGISRSSFLVAKSLILLQDTNWGLVGDYLM